MDNVPLVTLNGTPLKRVREFKYLGHVVTEDMSDDKDLERESVERCRFAVICWPADLHAVLNK